ncbi:MAG: hypothetical protein Q9163_001137 [Psora crenata]
MSHANRHADALLTDHFTYTPLSLIDDIINAVNTIVYQALDALEDGLFAVPPAQLGFKSSTKSAHVFSALAGQPDDSVVADAAKDEIENGVHRLETLLESTMDKSFDKFEIYTLRNILTVPDDLTKWIRLRHYEGLQLPPPDTAATPESILQLRRTVQETRKLNKALKARHTKNAALISQLHQVFSPSSTASRTTQSQCLAFLSQRPTTSSISQTPLTACSQFAVSQLPALRQLVAELRPKLGPLRDAGTNSTEWQSKREERRQYIEGGVRRIVGRDGFGDGADQGILEELAGMRTGKRGGGEVNALEGIIRGLGRGDEDRME